jgi:prephenate dehydrogenase
VRNLGAFPVIVKPREHDRIVAANSALSQLTSVVLALTVDALVGAKAGKLTGPGLESGLRLAASPYAVWRDALAENSANVRAALRNFDANLHKIMRALARGDDRPLARSFARAASSRLRVLSQPGRRGGRH